MIDDRRIAPLALDDTEIADLSMHTQQQRAWASEKFRKEIEALARRLCPPQSTAAVRSCGL